jgi:hypothetical protein
LFAKPIENQRSSDSLCVVSARVKLRGSPKIDTACAKIGRSLRLIPFEMELVFIQADALLQCYTCRLHPGPIQSQDAERPADGHSFGLARPEPAPR